MRKFVISATLAIGAVSCQHMPNASTLWEPAHALLPVVASIEPDLQQTVSRNLEKEVAEKKIPGMAVAVARRGRIVASVQQGVRKTGFSAPLAPMDRFHVGSLAKAMTATMIATLVEEGRIKWTTTPAEVFPGWTIHPDLRDVPLRDFLAHLAGLQKFTSGAEWKPELTGSQVEQRRQFARWLLAQKPMFKPGTWNYSNADYAIAGAMLEKLTGRSWQELIKERLFEPLQLKTAGFGWPYKAGPDEPWGHKYEGGQYSPRGPEEPYVISDVFAPGGDVHMSVEDLARFAALHLAGLQGTHGVVAAKTIQTMHQPVGGSGYALGWYSETKTFGEPRHWHGGETGRFRAQIWIFPDRNLALVAAANADTAEVNTAYNRIFQLARLAAIKTGTGNR